MENIKHKYQTGEDNSKLQEFLLSIKDFHSEGMGEAQFSYDFLEQGVKTQLTEQVEKLMQHPLQAFSDMSNEVDEKFYLIIESIAKSFFVYKKDLLSHVYKNNINSRGLHFSIVLKEDNFDNRNSIFEFFDTYDRVPFSSKFPIYFQFTPVELIEKLKIKNEINFA